MRKRIERIVCLLLSCCILASILPAAAAEEATGGSCGDNVTWRFDEASETLTIGGTGDMGNYVPTAEGERLTPWAAFTDDIRQVVMEYGVTSIGHSAFEGCANLTGVSIPDSVTFIGDDAFRASGLTSVTIPGSVTSLCCYVFWDCARLTEVILPSGLNSIGEGSFGRCTALTGIKIPYGVTSIGLGAFQECGRLSELTIPSSVTSIERGAFEACAGLTNVVIPESVTRIPLRLFKDCAALTSVTIPSSVKEIGFDAFEQSGLTHVYYGGRAAAWTSIKCTDASGDAVSDVILPGLLRTGEDAYATVHCDTTGPVESQYTVTFMPNGGTCSTKTRITDTEGRLASLPTPKRSGYYFSGWYTAKSGGSKVTSARVYTKDTTLYAHWRKLTSVTVTFNANGGTCSVKKRTTSSSTGKLSSLPTAKRSGYTFLGWYTAKSSGSKVSASTVYTQKTTLYAHWGKTSPR